MTYLLNKVFDIDMLRFLNSKEIIVEDVHILHPSYPRFLVCILTSGHYITTKGHVPPYLIGHWTSDHCALFKM